MDKYFCKDCLSLWKSNQWMMCCPGCVAHRDSGWTIPQVISVYGKPLEYLIKTQDSDPGVFFPSLHRQSQCSRCYPYNPRYDYQYDYASKYLNGTNEYPGFVKQQRKFLTMFRATPCKDVWDCLDPNTQKRLITLQP